jgi:hypothetical protein
MEPLSWDKRLGLVLPLESTAGQSDQTKHPSKDEDEVRDAMGLDASHHTRIFLRGEENIFSLTSSFIGQLNSSRWPIYCDHSVTSADVRLSVGPNLSRAACQ